MESLEQCPEKDAVSETNPEQEQPQEQQWLLPYANPLLSRIGKEFFSSIPKRPGVYRFYGENGSLLYVGKAKSLRCRLYSYKNASPKQVSRKVIRMIHLIRRIEWDECESETAALLRENRMLRELKPPFNVVNTRPQSYYFIGLRELPPTAGTPFQVRFRLTTAPKRKNDLLFGAYKCRKLATRGYTALLRLVWATRTTEDRFEFPTKLTRYNPPYLYSIDFPPEWFGLLKKFLNGSDDRLLVQITEMLLLNESIPRFAYGMLQEDLETARLFFERGPQRNRELKRNHGVTSRLIPQERIDDLIVLDRERRKTSPGAA